MKKFERFMSLIIDSDGTTPYRYRIAATFYLNGCLRDYLFSLEGSKKSEKSFQRVFKITQKEEILSMILHAISEGEFGTKRQASMKFNDLAAKLPAYTCDNKRVTNVTANNEFYSWLCVNDEGKRQDKPTFMNGVAFVRFADFIWHLFWDEKFQKWCWRLINL